MLYKPKLPKTWNSDLAYFSGLILGDGSLPKATSRRPNGKVQIRYLIHFFCSSLEFLKKVYIPLFFRLFKLKPRLVSIKNKKNALYNCTIESKELYLYLEKKGLTTGRKAKIADVPNLPKRLNIYLLAGLLDTDGGKKGSGFGLSTASEKLAQFCINLFKDLKFSYHSCPWFYKNHTYHQIYVHKKDFSKILKKIPLKNKEKLDFIYLYASVAQPGRAQVKTA